MALRPTPIVSGADAIAACAAGAALPLAGGALAFTGCEVLLAGADGAVVAGKILENKSSNYGFDAQTEKYTDMFKAGIIDPTKVVRTALQDAASIAGLLITTEAMVAERPERKEAAPMPGGGGMGGMDF